MERKHFAALLDRAQAMVVQEGARSFSVQCRVPRQHKNIPATARDVLAHWSEHRSSALRLVLKFVVVARHMRLVGVGSVEIQCMLVLLQAAVQRGIYL